MQLCLIEIKYPLRLWNSLGAANYSWSNPLAKYLNSSKDISLSLRHDDAVVELLSCQKNLVSDKQTKMDEKMGVLRPNAKNRRKPYLAYPSIPSQPIPTHQPTKSSPLHLPLAVSCIHLAFKSAEEQTSTSNHRPIRPQSQQVNFAFDLSLRHGMRPPLLLPG